MERSGPVHRLGAKLSEIQAGLKSVQKRLEQRSPSVIEAKVTQKVSRHMGEDMRYVCVVYVILSRPKLSFTVNLPLCLSLSECGMSWTCGTRVWQRWRWTCRTWTNQRRLWPSPRGWWRSSSVTHSWPSRPSRGPPCSARSDFSSQFVAWL